MHFEEYELFPSLIGLSPLPTSHPSTFQRTSVRSSITCYRNFNLLMGRSQRFRVYHNRLKFALEYSLSLRFTRLKRLTSPVMVTRRLIMQKARRHPT